MIYGYIHGIMCLIFLISKGESGFTMATIKDVARKAGVSISTVSRVLNNSGPVSEKARAAVLKAMEELGYTPHPWAKYLATVKEEFEVSMVMTPRIREYLIKKEGFYFEVYLGMKNVMQQIKVNERIVDKGEGIEDRVDGYLLIGADFSRKDVEKYMKTGKPVVLVDHYIPGMNVDAVVSDGYGGAYSVIRMMLKRGFKKVVHIHSDLRPYSFRERFEGYVSAMGRYGLMPKYYEFDDFNDNMSSVIDLLLKNYGKPEVIFTSNDFSALRAMEELEKRGYRVPDDVLLIGFDDSPEAEEVGLTTVRVHKDELGSFAMRRLITLMMGQDVHPAKISLFTKIIERNSTKISPS